MVTYSRMVLWSPISTAVGSPAYFLSCGGAPIEAKCQMRLLRPMRRCPSSTTWAPMVAALADLDVLADHRVRADLDVGREAGCAVDDGRRVDQAWSTGRTEQRIVASATTFPSTRATQPNLPMPRNARSITTSISSTSPGTTGFLKRALSMPT